MPEIEYTEVAPGLFWVDYITLDEPGYYLIPIAPEVEEALIGTGALRYLEDGRPAAIVKGASPSMAQAYLEAIREHNPEGW